MTTTKPFYEMPILTIDTETTGTDASNDRTVTASLVFDFPGEEPVVKSWLIDPYVLDKWQDKWRKGKRTLEVMAPHYSVELSNAHTSDADATATGEVARAIGRKFKLDMPLAELHQKQVEQRAAQCRDLETYLRKSNPSASIDGGWPIQTKAK